MDFLIVPVTLILSQGQIKEAACSDAEAMEWFIYAINPSSGERKVILHAMSREIAESVVEALDFRH